MINSDFIFCIRATYIYKVNRSRQKFAPMATLASSGRKDLGPRDHARSLAALCCICGRKKPDLKSVSLTLEVLVREHLPAYDISSNLHPTSICATCRLTVKAFEKDPQQTTRKFPPFLDYDLLYPIGTRASGMIPVVATGLQCNCGLCDIARLGLDYPTWHKSHSIKAGNPPSNKKTSTKVCQECWTEIRRGKSHKCGKKKKRSNLNKLIHSNSDPTVSFVVCSTLKTVATKQEVPPHKGTISLKSGGPKNVKVKIVQSQAHAGDERMVTHGDFLEIQRTIGCSDRKLLGLRRCLAVILGMYLKSKLFVIEIYFFRKFCRKFCAYEFISFFL